MAMAPMKRTRNIFNALLRFSLLICITQTTKNSYFKDKVKIGKMEASKSKLFNQTIALDDDCISAKSVLKKQLTTKGKENDPDFHSEHEISSDSDGLFVL